jgi:pseudouridine kinase
MTIYVFGGSTIDVNARIAHQVKEHDSNPGDIAISFGGVAHNVALNLANLGEEVSYITVVSDDPFPKQFIEDCKQHKIDVSKTYIITNQKPSMYVSIQGQNKDMSIAVNDMKIFEEFTPEIVAPIVNRIGEADLVFLDTNLRKDTIAYILKHSKAKVFIDPVSTFKIKKLKGLLKNVYAIKPNLLEAQTLSGKKTLKEIGTWFLKQGVKHLYISRGPRGVYGYSKAEVYHGLSKPVQVKNVTGAGDAMMAGIIRQESLGKSLKDTIEFASIMAQLTIECEHTVADISVKQVKRIMRENKHNEN